MNGPVIICPLNSQHLPQSMSGMSKREKKLIFQNSDSCFKSHPDYKNNDEIATKKDNRLAKKKRKELRRDFLASNPCKEGCPHCTKRPHSNRPLPPPQCTPYPPPTLLEEFFKTTEIIMSLN